MANCSEKCFQNLLIYKHACIFACINMDVYSG